MCLAPHSVSRPHAPPVDCDERPGFSPTSDAGALTSFASGSRRHPTTALLHCDAAGPAFRHESCRIGRTPSSPKSDRFPGPDQLRGRSAFPGRRPRDLYLSHVPEVETQPRVHFRNRIGRSRRCQAALGLFDTSQFDHHSHNCDALQGGPACREQT